MNDDREVKHFKRDFRKYSGWPASQQAGEDREKEQRMREAARQVTKRGPGRPPKHSYDD